MKAKPYPEYKDSGVAWLGKVPRHWDVCAPKRKIRAASGGTVIKGECAGKPEKGLFPGFSASGQDVWIEHYDYDCQGIVLSAVGARCGKTFKADGLWAVAANTHCLFPLENADRNYLWYLTNNETWWEKGGSAQPFIKVFETLSRHWVFPPFDEQKQIADYLDWKTGRIDALIAKKRKLVEKLREKRIALITQAVTKGLDASAPMKDSGGEWLGEVPKFWTERRLKYAVIIRNEKIEAESSTFEYLGLEHIESWTGKRIPDETASSEGIAARFIKGDILFGKLRPYLAKVYLAEAEGMATTEALVLRGDDDLYSKFLKYTLLSDKFIKAVSGSTYGAKMPRANWEDIGGLFVLFPSLNEQKQIADYLDSETAKIDSLISKIETAISRLTEYRTALITAATTGQIDVRNAKIPSQKPIP